MTHVVVVAALTASGQRWITPGLIRGISVAAGIFLLAVAVQFGWSAFAGLSRIPAM